jgi:hypothetical protein
MPALAEAQMHVRQPPGVMVVDDERSTTITGPIESGGRS